MLTRTSFAAAWKTSGPSSRTTATGSICCQNRCEASSSTPDVRRAGELDELADVGGVEHDVLRVQFEGHLHVVVGGKPVGFLPEVGRDAPLVVEHVQGGRVPGVDHPVDRGGPGLAAGQAGHGDHPVLSQPLRQPDGAADVLGVLLADLTLGVQRVAVAVQAGDRDAGALEDREVVVAGRVAFQDLVDGGDVDGRQESARVDLDAGQPQVGDNLERLGKGPVVQDCVVDAEFHSVTFCSVVERGFGDGTEQLHVAHALVEGGTAGQRLRLADAGDFLKERPGLVGEGVVLAESDARGRPWPGRRRCRGVRARGSPGGSRSRCRSRR